MRTIWVLGDQLNRDLGAMADVEPGDARILLVESAAKLGSKRWHRQRAHLVVGAMRRFAAELRDAGFAVDHRRAPSLAAGLAAHRAEHDPESVAAMEPASWDGLELLRRLDVDVIRSDQFLCHHEDFADFARDRSSLKMEDFYRWQRRRLGYLMDGDEPCEGRWNFDADNREPPPTDGRSWPDPVRDELDDLDREVLADLPEGCWGADPDGTWATSRERALARLDHAIEEVLPRFGPHEDAMLTTSWHLAHTLLSPYLNLGLLSPAEVCDAAEAAYRDGRVPIASAEGFIRQVIGWREYVWGRYWQQMPEYRAVNALDAQRPLPPAFTGAPTEMRCVSHVVADVEAHGWTHHIARLMVLGNLSLTAGVEPWALTEWMWASFVDGAEWVMLPNVLGMALHADGGQMATKPYASSGAYLDRMSDYCGDCAFDRRKRTGDDACPFTTLYWNFIDRHRDRFERNPRMVRQVGAADRLGDLDEVAERAEEVLVRLDRGDL
ncbi:MAG: cryptochrome/photolyase family protein [Acidimicrobiales bacterium]|nr:cryptochrome/photolyase family protein [Acidimicrobiales bacterium]